jgi:hypothetical protein
MADIEGDEYPSDFINDPEYQPRHRKPLPGWYVRLREWLLRKDGDEEDQAAS